MTSAPDLLDAISPVPVGTSVLHIGPHKTGTSALQLAMRRAREDMLDQGVLLAGPGAGDGDGDGVRFALGMRTTLGDDVGRQVWERIRADLTDTSVPRRVFSRETFANATTKRARVLVEALGHGAVPLHVVVSARPLAELIPSQYSQFVQRGTCLMPFEPWVREVFADRSQERTARMFWKRHSHDEQVRRWGDLVGHENVTVVVVDRKEPLFLAHAFERLLALRTDTIAALMEHDRSNRSLTMAEIDLVRQWHEITAETGADHGKVVRLAWRLCYHLRSFNPEPTDPRLTLPPWAVELANERSAAGAAAIVASGAHVVGDLSSLSAVGVPA
ncbi:hypothetical protein P5P86_03420 [Nocardioides sp. BP30]|uniref:hypothetical protein n=1 Tax=Nocardioides sp. BP30 TaxID=3036374 RepID=UPI002468ADEC|nr:hypothetical protein [Nocardioides sp. BP30]WGL52879.1 hypothetical protein P5P86_03420 [Nocardioides sp. BP30]